MLPLFAVMLAIMAGIHFLTIASREETPYWLRTIAMLALVAVALCALQIWTIGERAAVTLQQIP